MGTQKLTIKPKRRLRFLETVAPHPKTRTEFKRRTRAISISDAELIVRWLNASRGTVSRKRILSIRQELEEWGTEFDALRQHEKELREMNPLKAVQAKRKFAKQLEHFRKRHNALSMQLSNYNRFRPVLDYSVDTGELHYTLVSDDGWRGFNLRVSDENEITVTVKESDVVAALARLAANRELRKVHLCVMCKDRWHLVLRRIDKFCSKECRENYHTHSPEYLERKRKSQSDYRERLKHLQQIGLA